jgi:hypothetical protein
MSVSSYKICRKVNGFLEGDALDVAMAVVAIVVGFSVRKEDMWLEWNHPNIEKGNGGVGGNDDTTNDDWVSVVVVVVAIIVITF